MYCPERVVCVCGEAESSEAALDWRCCHINPLSATLRFLCSVNSTRLLDGISARKRVQTFDGGAGRVCAVETRLPCVCVCGQEESFLYVLFAWAVIQLPFTTQDPVFFSFSVYFRALLLICLCYMANGLCFGQILLI